MSDKDMKIALVSGANRGIGAAVAAGLARAGVHVLLGSRTLAAGEAAAAPIRAEGGTVTPVQLDVTDAQSVADLAAKLGADYGHIDILVNNAGVGLDYVPGLSPVEKIEQTLAINVVGGLRLTEAMLPLLEKSAAARIVNVSSELASFGLRHDPSWGHHDKVMPLYAASKAAVNALTVGYALSLAPKGIKVNAICPGYTATAATNFMPDRTVDQAAVVILQMALLAEDGPTGGFFNDQGALPW